MEMTSWQWKILLFVHLIPVYWDFPLPIFSRFVLLGVLFVFPGLVHVGDELREVNGNLITHKRPDEISQILVKIILYNYSPMITVGTVDGDAVPMFWGFFFSPSHKAPSH